MGERSASLQRLHHTLTDGVGGMKLLRSLLERTQGPESDGNQDENAAASR